MDSNSGQSCWCDNLAVLTVTGHDELIHRKKHCHNFCEEVKIVGHFHLYQQCDFQICLNIESFAERLMRIVKCQNHL